MENLKQSPADTPFDKLMELIATLRGPDGCPWDRQQTPVSMINYLLEETYELADAIESNDPAHVREELGDVLFHIFFIAHLFSEKNDFGIDAVAATIIEKMTRRHPHVFGDKKVKDTDEIRANWHKIKKAEQKNTPATSVLDSIPKKLPALMRAYRVSERAARTGFDWPDIKGVLAKTDEEIAEFKEALAQRDENRDGPDEAAMEFGDILFTLVNVARFAKFHPETALTAAINKFEGRFKQMEKNVAHSGRTLDAISFEEMNRLWNDVKAGEKD